MTETEHLLDILIEECAEVIQRATKAKRFGLEETQPEQLLTNQQRIVCELNDLVATADMLLCARTSADWVNPKMVEAKQAKVKHYLGYSRECGTLSG